MTDDTGAFESGGHDGGAYDRGGYGSAGYDSAGYDSSGYDSSGYDRGRYDERAGFDPEGYGRQGRPDFLPAPDRATGLGPGWGPPPPFPPAPVRTAPPARLYLALAVVIALVAGTAGSLGTYLLTRPRSGPDPSYRLGAMPSASISRAPESVAGVAARVLPSVVSLEVKGNQEAGTGSGFVIQGGYIVTNNHVVAVAAQSGEIRIRFNNRRSTTAKIIGRDPNSDIAVVKPEDTFGAPEVTLGNSDGVVVGDPVIAIGSPLGLTGTVTTGIVSSLNRPVEAGGESGTDYALINAIQTDAAINPGNSGGPLVNTAGQVIGVNSAIATLGSGAAIGQQTGSIGLGFAIPVNHVRRVAQELITTGSARTSRIGITIDSEYRGQGVRIASGATGGEPAVTPGGPADKAGIKPGDIILEVDGQPVDDSRELIVTIRSKAPGDRVRIRFQHDGDEKTATVTVGAAPAPTARPS
ncbi:S1C family serine protease [Microtetraspora niveoalba]|uniref:S1C family serine protease n=1 Tax=Microtetraspora niveoalba TaxID=46175 RepID=UPI000834D681|nr:trypsin-like peptidase domain-containing protein [Microtetraspora niveoalba]